MGAFDSMVLHLASVRTTEQKVSRVDYDNFCKEFVFDQLKGKSFGAAFCERFNIVDYVLPEISNHNSKSLIETLGYLET